MDFWILALGMGLVAFLYSSVGHAGASGYLAVMALGSFPVDQMKPMALVLNIMVSILASWNFYRAGHLHPRLLIPLVMGSVPFAFLGGYGRLPVPWFQILVGSVLGFSAWRLWATAQEEKTVHRPRDGTLAATGAALGLLAGLTGTGGGVFLTPWMLARGWAVTKTAAAVSSVFILCNSTAGLAGYFTSVRTFPESGAGLLAVVAVAGWAGSRLGSRRFSPLLMRKLLAVVLLIAAAKLILTR